MIKAVEVKQRRKLIQAQHEDEYREALVTLDREVYENEGPDMKEEMMDQLRDWCDIGTRLGRQGAQPSPFTSPRPAPSLPAGTSSFVSAKGKGDKKDAKKDGGKKGKKGDAGDGEEEEGPPPHFVIVLKDSFQEWSDKWQHRNEATNFAQKYDGELVKQMVRPDVQLRVREEVNAAIDKELQNLKEAYERDLKAKKAKGKSSRVARVTYALRALPDGATVEEVGHGQMKDYVGSFGHLGATFDKKAAEEMATRPWVPEPSPAQVRAMVTEFCVLPLGSQGVKDHAPLNTYINKKGNRAPKNGRRGHLTGARLPPPRPP